MHAAIFTYLRSIWNGENYYLITLLLTIISGIMFQWLCKQNKWLSLPFLGEYTNFKK